MNAPKTSNVMHNEATAELEHKALRFLTAGSVDDGKSTLIGRLLYDSKRLFDDQLAALERDSRRHGTQGHDIDYALLLDDDDTVSIGSRGVCYAKRTLEVLDRIGCDNRFVDKGVSWDVGRTFFGEGEVFNAGKTGKAAGLLVVEGVIRKRAGARHIRARAAREGRIEGGAGRGIDGGEGRARAVERGGADQHLAGDGGGHENLVC